MKSLKKQLFAASVAALVITAGVIGCKKESDYGTESSTATSNTMDSAVSATTNAAGNAWDATKEGARKTGDAMSDAAGRMKEGATNAWDSLTSTNH